MESPETTALITRVRTRDLTTAVFYCSPGGPNAAPGSLLTRSRNVGPKVRFAIDSPLEGDGFELPVPREMTTIFEPSCFWFL
jgi:hypothetical protein